MILAEQRSLCEGHGGEQGRDRAASHSEAGGRTQD